MESTLSTVPSFFACVRPQSGVRSAGGRGVSIRATLSAPPRFRHTRAAIPDREMTAMLLATTPERWPFWLGGLAIGGFVLLLLFATRNLLGVSTGFADACSAPFDPAMRRSWRIPLLLGILAGGFVAAVTSGAFSPTWSVPMFDARVTDAFVPKALLFLGGGV